jgi:hypothetical protein
LVREVAAYQAKGEYHFLRGLLLRFRQASFLASLVLTLAAATLGYAIYRESPMLIPFLIAAALILLHTANVIQVRTVRQ